MKNINVALCEGRHEIPQATDGSIFPSVVNPLDIEGMSKHVVNFFQNKEFDNVNLYVTGLTVALVEVIKYCYDNNINLTLYHFNKADNNYYPQTIQA
jgi:hypothetical protein